MKKSLPFDYYIENKKLVVNELLSEDLHLIHLGKAKHQQTILPTSSEIISIDHRDLSSMMKVINEYISSDENDLNFKYYRVSQLFEFYRNIVFDTQNDSLLIKYRNN